MKILQTNSYNPSCNFKATYPVVHWVAESNGSYAPISNLKDVKKLQSKIIRILNKPLYNTKKEISFVEQTLRDYIGRCDVDYRNMSLVRSFYNRAEGDMSGKTPVAYVISGKDIEPFEEQLSKNIGIAKGEAKKTLQTSHSPEADAAVEAYKKGGLTFVNNPDLRIKNKENNMTYVLHTKFEIIRNKLGKVKDYKFIGARFLPEHGPESPFERLKNYM